MPHDDLHQALIDSKDGPRYTAIPTLASWKGDIVSAMNRLRQFRKQALAAHFEAQRPGFDAHRQAMASQFAPLHGANPAAAVNSAQLKRAAFVAAVQQQQRQQQPPPQQPTGRIAGALTNPDLVDAAITRYQAGKDQAGNPNDQVSKAILGSLLVDIYTVTGQFMSSISRNAKLRTDNDCALFPLYRSLHWAAADAFGEVFGINGDEIDVYLRRQLIFMTDHGVDVDINIKARMPKDSTGAQGSQLAYLSDEEALACRLQIEDGKFMIINGQGDRDPFDCSGAEYRDKENTAYQGTEANGGQGVAGFAMGLSRAIYARKHGYKRVPKGAFYHSSYLAGSELLCAGCITVVKGELVYINNFSGHYQPSRQQLSLALQALRAQGVDITKVTVENLKRTGKTDTALAPAFLAAEAAAGKDFDGVAKGRFTDLARRIREVVAAYEKRRTKWYANPKEKSLRLMNALKSIDDDEMLVREVRYRFKRFFEVQRVWGDDARSPLGTPESELIDNTDSELPKRLYEALKPSIVAARKA